MIGRWTSGTIFETACDFLRQEEIQSEYRIHIILVIHEVWKFNLRALPNLRIHIRKQIKLA